MNNGHRILTLLPGALLLVLAGLALVSPKAEQGEEIAPATGLYLTHLALFPEAPHTRHPLLSDLQSAFREGPGAMEHTISSIFLPNPYLAGSNGAPDQ